MSDKLTVSGQQAAVSGQRPAGLAQALAVSVGHWHGVFEAQAEKARAGFVGATQARLLAGAALLGLKRAVRHGEFEPLRAAHFPALTERTAQLWKARAELDLRTPELRQAVEGVLRDQTSKDAQTTFDVVSRAHFAARATLCKGAAEEMQLLPEPAAKRPVERKPAKALTADAQVAKRVEAAARDGAALEQQFAGYGSAFVLLPDAAVLAQMAFLERQLAARHQWVSTPAKHRDVTAVERKLNPPSQRSAASGQRPAQAKRS